MATYDSQHIRELKTAGDAAFKRANFRHAWERYSAALQALAGHDPDLRCILLSNRCAALTHAGRIDEALADAQELKDKKPDWYKSWLRAAKALEQGKQYLAALHEYSQAYRLVHTGAEQGALKQQMQLCAQHLSLPEMSATLMHMLFPATLRQQQRIIHQPQLAHSCADDLQLMCVHDQAVVPACATQQPGCTTGAESVQTAELQEACFLLVKQLKADGPAHGFPALLPRFVGWMCGGLAHSFELYVLRAQVLSRLQMWLAAAAHAQQAVEQAKHALASITALNEQEQCVDQLALAFHVLGSSLTQGALATQATAVLPVQGHLREQLQSGLTNLCVALELNPRCKCFEQSLSCDDVQILGGELLCQAAATAKQVAQQVINTATRTSIPLRPVLQADTDEVAGTTPAQSCHWQKDVHVESAVPDIQLSLHLAFPEATKTATTAAARRQLCQLVVDSVQSLTSPHTPPEPGSALQHSNSYEPSMDINPPARLVDVRVLLDRVALPGHIQLSARVRQKPQVHVGLDNTSVCQLHQLLQQTPHSVIAAIAALLPCCPDLTRHLGRLDGTTSACLCMSGSSAALSQPGCTNPTTIQTVTSGPVTAYKHTGSEQAQLGPRQLTVPLPYSGYSLVTSHGRLVERPTKHGFALSRVYYSPQELPDDGEQVWFQPSGDSCRWRQTASEVVVMPTQVPKGTRAKQLVIEIQPFHLVVRDSAVGAVYLSGQLERGVLPSSSTWWIDDGCIIISLAKMNLELHTGACHHADTWWPRLMRHHAHVAWDDAHKDYTDLPAQVLERHTLAEAHASAMRAIEAPSPLAM